MQPSAQSQLRRGGYECVGAVLDSSAGEFVSGPQHFASTSTNSSAGRAGAGVEYVCADGGHIPNLGEKLVGGVSDERHMLSINFQVACVDKPLIAVSKLTAAGHEVWLGRRTASSPTALLGRAPLSPERTASTCSRCGRPGRRSPVPRRRRGASGAVRVGWTTNGMEDRTEAVTGPADGGVGVRAPEGPEKEEPGLCGQSKMRR